MAAIYGFKKFDYPTTERITLPAVVTGGAGATDNPGYLAVTGLGRKDVGAIIKIKSGAASLVDKSAVALSDGEYYLLMEVPDEHKQAVVYVLDTQAKVNNLIATTYKGFWPEQFAKLRTEGAK